jgi:RNA polymerase sigma-70 factor (ECF subfamily)
VCSKQYADCSDEVLLRAVIQKDGGAFEALYHRHVSGVYNILLRIVRNESVAEELLQDTFWQVWQKADQYDERGAGVAWLHQIARRKALDQLHRQKARPRILAADVETFEWLLKAHQPSAERVFEQDWTRQQVWQALDQIPREQRLCLELAYFEGLSHQAIAEQTDTPLGTIKTRIRSGMEKLERWLLGRGCVYTPASASQMATSE